MISNEEKYKRLFYLVSQWGIYNHRGFSIDSYLSNAGYTCIGIYGMDKLGLLLLEELKNTNITVRYGIDRNAFGIFCEVKVYLPTEVLEPVDAIVVTAVNYYDEIVKSLEKMSCPIISLEDIVYSFIYD